MKFTRREWVEGYYDYEININEEFLTMLNKDIRDYAVDEQIIEITVDNIKDFYNNDPSVRNLVFNAKNWQGEICEAEYSQFVWDYFNDYIWDYRISEDIEITDTIETADRLIED